MSQEVVLKPVWRLRHKEPLRRKKRREAEAWERGLGPPQHGSQPPRWRSGQCREMLDVARWPGALKARVRRCVEVAALSRPGVKGGVRERELRVEVTGGE